MYMYILVPGYTTENSVAVMVSSCTVVLHTCTMYIVDIYMYIILYSIHVQCNVHVHVCIMCHKQ